MLNEYIVTLYRHSERSEESRTMMQKTRFFAMLRMTEFK
jgi:hypothetical protein